MKIKRIVGYRVAEEDKKLKIPERWVKVPSENPKKVWVKLRDWKNDPMVFDSQGSALPPLPVMHNFVERHSVRKPKDTDWILVLAEEA